MQGTQTTIRQKWHWTLILKVSTRGTHLSSRFLHEGHTSPQGSYMEDTLVLKVPTQRTHLSSVSLHGGHTCPQAHTLHVTALYHLIYLFAHCIAYIGFLCLQSNVGGCSRCDSVNNLSMYLESKFLHVTIVKTKQRPDVKTS